MTTKDWHGHIGAAPVPLTVHNGQWAGFLHVKTGGAAVGSTGAVVYRATVLDGTKHDFMLAWSNPFARGSWDNAVSQHSLAWGGACMGAPTARPQENPAACTPQDI